MSILVVKRLYDALKRRCVLTSPDGVATQNTNTCVRLLRFEVLTAVRITSLLFWIVTPCRLISRYQI
jgi:hypothetical protein